MSAFDEWIARHDADNAYLYGRPDRKEVWNAALTHAAEICMEQYFKDPARLDAESSASKARAYDKAIIDCSNAIMREGGNSHCVEAN